MATFDDSIGGGLTTGATTPKYGQRKVSRPNTRIVRFADGYEQRIVFGLQIKIQEYLLLLLMYRKQMQ